MFYYLYRVTNMVNNRVYVGVRRSSVSPELDPYMGSGKVLKHAQKKYGMDSFRKEILEIFDTMTAAYKREAEIVTEEFIKDPLVYNLVPGGKGGDHWSMLPNREDIIERKRVTQKKSMSQMTKEERSLKYGSHGEKNFFHEYNKTRTREEIQKNRELYDYTIVSPSGIVIKTRNLFDFCKKEQLNRDTFMYFMNKGKIPPSNNVGPKPRNNLRANTVGWSISKTLLD